MSKIRSALEIALEKTESVESNPERIEEEKYTQEGQRLISKYLFEKAYSLDDIQEKITSAQGSRKSYLLAGIAHALVSNISLPQNDLYVESLGSIKEAIESLTPCDDVKEQFAELDRFFQQYLEQTEQLQKSLAQKYAPKLRQKQQQLAKQFGAMVELTPEQDPEFIDLLSKHRQQLDDQYQQVLDNFKDQLREMIKSGHSASS